MSAWNGGGGGGGMGGMSGWNGGAPSRPFGHFGRHRHRHWHRGWRRHHFRNPFRARWGRGRHGRHRHWRMMSRSGHRFFFRHGMDAGELADLQNLPDDVRQRLGDNEQEFVNYGTRFKRRFNLGAMEDIAGNFNDNYATLQELKSRPNRRRFRFGMHPFMHLSRDQFKRILLPIPDETLSPSVIVDEGDGTENGGEEGTTHAPSESDYQADIEYNDQDSTTETTPEETTTEETSTDYGGEEEQGKEEQEKEEQEEQEELPTSFDWRDQVTVSTPKHQWDCGSCWTFASAGVLEIQHARQNNDDQLDLAEMDHTCVYNGTICDGGFPKDAFKYFMENPGIGLESDDPYDTDKEMLCREISPAVRVREVIDLLPFDMEKTKRALIKNGPFAVGIYVNDDFQYYKEGIFDKTCEGLEKLGGHAIVVVGYGVEDDVPYWIAKNSWGDDWGEGGYIKFKAGENLCRIESWFQTQAIIE
ncbi:unnamed protein product, partial [Mesorhabditis belari]|uniref:Peptidase C1A papain C-terminal domain-containing protein n=1 Tax=Mesorhabditis belari TaxID=2138241 RepID=A0AAF3J219_9BILA